MEFTFIDSLLENYTIELNALKPDAELYSTMLLQHTGNFDSREGFFGNENDETTKFNQFLIKAKNDNIELVVTPEYSCPWSSIRNILNDTVNFPNLGKLWVLGCESITPNDINSFKDEFHQSSNIEVFFEEDIFENSTGVLLNPCCYIFKALDNNDDEKLIVLIQFKTQNMGVWNNDVERQKLISGKRAYILRNNDTSINLLTIICSDAIQFDTQNIEGRWSIDPYIVISIQMNPNPNHERFRAFRNSIVKFENKDVISLNWSSESNILNVYCKSNIAINTDHIKNCTKQELSDLKQNHTKGLYYSFMKPRRHCFYLNPNINIIIYNISKTNIGQDDPVRYRRRGPRVQSTMGWNVQNGNFIEIDEVSDGFIELMESLNISSNGLLTTDIDFIDKERLINLTVGEIDIKEGGDNWHQINKLKSFIINDSEAINRFTVTFDEETEESREYRILKIEELNNDILTKPEAFPDVVASFKNNCTEVMFLNNNGLNYKYNLVTNDNENHATVVYLGQVKESKVIKVLNTILELFPEKYRKHERIVIWYKPNVNSLSHKSNSTPIITDTQPNNITSIV